MDKHSKRNKSKDNPYTLNYDEVKNVYLVEFIDSMKAKRIVEVSDEVYNAFDQFELEDISQIHKIRRHIEHSELYDETLYHRALDSGISIEEEIENKIINEELRNAINKLSDIQKRRIKMYYFEGLTQQQIADKEHTSIRAIQYTLNDSIKKLKEILKNLKN